MNSGSDNKSADGYLAAVLGEGACLFVISCSLMEQVSPGAGKTGKTLTSPEWVADLEATVNGGNGVERNYSTSSQGRHVNVILRPRL